MFGFGRACTCTRVKPTRSICDHRLPGFARILYKRLALGSTPNKAGAVLLPFISKE